VKTSQAGIDMIKRFEGKRLSSYHDSVGVLTIGYGTTGKHVHEHQHISIETAEAWLREDVRRFEHCIVNAVKVPLTQNEFDALVSFTYNLGCGAFRKSTLLKKINDKQMESASGEFPRWSHAGGKVLAGLVTRRDEERELFLT